jgi:hypothetical protein
MRDRRAKADWMLLLLVALCGASCREQPSVPAAGTQAPAASAGSSTVAAALDRSAQYLAGLCDERGQFTYRVHLDPNVAVPPAYNELRHAGAVYALAQYCQRTPDPAVHDAMLRGARFLRQELLAPVPGNQRMLAAWLAPELADESAPRQAKLGGAGLALVALLTVEQVAPGSTPLEELRGLGRFIIFMQKSDGTFYSKFVPDAGRSDIWDSDYYPGEAALGLILLYAQDPARQWLETAAKALDGIVQRGAATRPTFPDQWFLLAAAQMLRLEPDASLPMSRDTLLAHARQICEDMLREQQRQAAAYPQIAGCFTEDGRSCPSATRLEGLLAALRFLPANDPQLQASIRASIEDGMRFLLRCQITTGPHAGAFPRVLLGYAQPQNTDKLRAQEVRIDYVQHAMSALIGYEAEFSKK